MFQGTNDARDWLANLSIWKEPKQYAQVQEYVKNLLAKPEYAGIPVVVAGDSLGGAIALNVSLRQSTKERPLNAYAFNASPRASYDPVPSLPAQRILISERAEFLTVSRVVWHRKIAVYKHYPVNFLDFNMVGKAVTEHAIYRLARGLLLVSIGKDDAYAKEVFRANFSIEQTSSASGQDEREMVNEAMCKSLLTPRTRTAQH